MCIIIIAFERIKLLKWHSRSSLGKIVRPLISLIKIPLSWLRPQRSTKRNKEREREKQRERFNCFGMSRMCRNSRARCLLAMRRRLRRSLGARLLPFLSPRFFSFFLRDERGVGGPRLYPNRSRASTCCIYFNAHARLRLYAFKI